MSGFFVYVLASKAHGKLYVGITKNLKKTVSDHKMGMVRGFPGEYEVKILVYYEHFENYGEALVREQSFNKWKNRNWLISLIQQVNPTWRDLYKDLVLELS